MDRRLRWLLGALLLLAGHLASSALLLDPSVFRQAPFWLPTGIAVVGVWYLGPGGALVVFLATLTFRLVDGRSPLEALLPAIGTAAEALIALALLRRLQFRPTIVRFRDALALAVVAAVAPLASSGAAGATRLFEHARLPAALALAAGWWRMNSLGVLLVAPLLFTWMATPAPRPSRRQLLEAVVWAGLVAGFFHYDLLLPADPGLGLVLSYALLPAALYPAVRWGTRGAATAAVLLSVLLTATTQHGMGPFLVAGPSVRHLALQMLLLVLIVPPLLVGALITQLATAEGDRTRLESIRRALLLLLPDVKYRLTPDGTVREVIVPPGTAPAHLPAFGVGGAATDLAAAEGRVAIADALDRARRGDAPRPVEYDARIGDRKARRESRFVSLGPDEILGVERDLTQRYRSERQVAWQAEILAMVASGQPTREVLERAALGVEVLSEGGLCSVLLLQGRLIHVAAGPSLPPAYNSAIEGIEIGPRAGSCGTAAYHNRTVIVSDIASDPLWEQYRAVALSHGLRACWSVPIRGVAGEVLGTFAIYYEQPRSPTEEELALVKRAAAVAGIALERARTEDLLASINRNLQDGLFRTSPEQGLRFANQAMARMFGYDSPEELLRLHPDELHAEPEQRRGLTERLHRDGRVVNEELRFRRRDGSVFWGLVSATAVPGPDGNLQYFDGAVADITLRKQLEAQLRQAQKMEAVGKLAGGVAHDFNNLLTAISGFASALTADLDPGSPSRQDAEEILRAAERAAGLTRQLLAYSRQQVLSPRVLDLRSVVEDLTGMLGRLIGEDVRLVQQHADGAALVRVDRGQIEQVILNLALNARDAMPEGGTLTISTRLVELDENTVRSHVGMSVGPHVCLTIHDTGHGMDNTTRERAFDPFFTTKEPGKGTGLGLSTVYGIVKQSGGSIWLESAPGAGTSVLVYLPRIAEEPAVEEAPRAGVGSDRGDATILVVEDEPMVRKLICRTLHRAGYVVLDAEDGASALAVSRRHPGPLDLVVSDVIMPRISGPELLERLAGERPGLRVLFVSGYTDEALTQRGALAPGTEFLQKPFAPADLLARVGSLLTADRERH